MSEFIQQSLARQVFDDKRAITTGVRKSQGVGYWSEQRISLLAIDFLSLSLTGGAIFISGGSGIAGALAIYGGVHLILKTSLDAIVPNQDLSRVNEGLALTGVTGRWAATSTFLSGGTEEQARLNAARAELVVGLVTSARSIRTTSQTGPDSGAHLLKMVKTSVSIAKHMRTEVNEAVADFRRDRQRFANFRANSPVDQKPVRPTPYSDDGNPSSSFDEMPWSPFDARSLDPTYSLEPSFYSPSDYSEFDYSHAPSATDPNDQNDAGADTDAAGDDDYSDGSEDYSGDDDE